MARRHDRVAHALMEPETILAGPAGADENQTCVGSLSGEQFAALLPILTRHTSSAESWFLLWDGFGNLNERAFQRAIGAIAILASANALTHSYAGLYDWAAHHSLTGWQAMSWPAEIDVFLAIGELALYVAYLDGWPARQRIWQWATALIGLGVNVAGNIGHIQPEPGHPVILADRLTAATSPIAAFAGGLCLPSEKDLDACSSPIGLAIADAFAREGAQVITGSRSITAQLGKDRRDMGLDSLLREDECPSDHGRTGPNLDHMKRWYYPTDGPFM
jgi:hypothetical protein